MVYIPLPLFSLRLQPQIQTEHNIFRERTRKLPMYKGDVIHHLKAWDVQYVTTAVAFILAFNWLTNRGTARLACIWHLQLHWSIFPGKTKNKELILQIVANSESRRLYLHEKRSHIKFALIEFETQYYESKHAVWEHNLALHGMWHQYYEEQHSVSHAKGLTYKHTPKFYVSNFKENS